MKKVILIVLSLAVSTMVQSQENWTVGYGKKIILKNVAEDQVKNTFSVSNSGIGKSSLFITLHKVDTANNVTLMVYTEDRNGLKNWDYTGKKITIPGNEIKKLLQEHKKLLFYYTAIPKDPALAAVIRVRQIHVCTVTLK